MAVQIYGIENLVEAFDNMQVECWSIHSGKDLLTKGSGKETLAAFLEMLNHSNSKDTYKLKVYEDCTDPKTIKEKTEASGSLSFKLYEADGYAGDGQYERVNRKNKLLERIEALEAERLLEAEEEPETIGSIAMQYLKDPQALGQLVDVARGLISILAGQQPQQSFFNNAMPSVARIGSVEQNGNMQKETEEQKLFRLSTALDTLEKHDAKIVDHLEKLAIVASNDPQKFQTLLGMLDLM